MDEVQQNVLFFSIIIIGLLIISTFFIVNVFEELRMLNLIVALQQTIIWLPGANLSTLFLFFKPSQYELYAQILFIIGIGLKFFTIIFLLRKDFDWDELWQRYSLIILTLSLIIVGIGFGLILHKREIISIYILLTIALKNSGYLGYLFAPHNVVDIIFVIGIDIGVLCSNFYVIKKYSIW